MRNLASTRLRSPRFPRAFPAATTVMLVLSLGWLVAPTPAAAQDDDEPFAEAGVSGNTYESPTFGYSLEWDDSIWQVEEAETSDDNDFLYLKSDGSDLYFESYDRFDGDAVECRDNAVSSIEDDDRVTEFETLDEDEDDISAFASFSYVVTIDDQALPMTQYSECRVLVEGESVLQIDHLAPQDDYEAESALVADVLDTLALPGQESDDTASTDDEEADSTPAADDATEEDEVEPAEATEETDDSEDAQTDDEADVTEEASDDEEAQPTEEVTDEDATDDEEEPTPTAAEDEDEAAADDEDAEATEEADTGEDEDADTEATEAADTSDDEGQDDPADEVDPDDLEGVDDDTYTSPTFGYTLEWDADVWTATTATSEDDVDTLVLENDVTVLTLVGTEEFEENLDRCVRTARRGVEGQDGVADVTPVEDADGDPIEIDEDERAGAVYTIVSEDEDAPDQVAQIECRVAVAGEAVIQIVQITPASDFNDQIDPVAEILDSIILEGNEDEEEETPTSEDEPTPDDEEEDEGESAVDGNSYVSPNFGYSVEWNEDVWTFDEEDDTSESTEPGFDTLFLESDNSGLGIIGAEFPDGETCVTEFASFFRTGDDIDNWAPFEDDDGERIEGERDGGYFAAFTATITATGQELEIVYYFECREVVEGESVVLFFMTTSPAAYDDATAELDDLLETLTFADEAEDGGEDDPTPTAEDEVDANPTPEDEDEETEPTPDDEEEDDSDSTASSGDLDSYTDPDFPFSVTWDESVWSVADQRTVADGHNLLNLTADDSDLTIEGWARWDGEPTDCLNDITLNLRAIDGVENFERVSDSDLYPENESAGGAYALYSYTLAPEGRTPVDYFSYVLCRTVVEGEAVVVLTLLVPAEDYEAIRPEFEPILASIEIDE